MNGEEKTAYTKRTENMVRPEEVGIISTFGSMLGAAPVGLQKAIMERSMKANPHMGFVVEPYAFFLCHEITDLEAAQKLVPAHHKIIPTRIFADDEPRPYVIFGAFTVHTSAFWGSRIEMYVITENTETGLLSWVIADYDTNTLSFDPGQGFVDGNALNSVVTTTWRGTVLVDMESPTRRIAAEADLGAGIATPLDQRLWLEGNLSVAYGGELDDGRSASFGLVFEPGEMVQALRIPKDAVRLDEITWHPGLFAPEPAQVVCFPYAQHFITSGIPTDTGVRTEEQLLEAVATINGLPPSKGFSSKAIRRSMYVSGAVSFLVTNTLLIWLVLHYVLKH